MAHSETHVIEAHRATRDSDVEGSSEASGDDDELSESPPRAARAGTTFKRPPPLNISALKLSLHSATSSPAGPLSRRTLSSVSSLSSLLDASEDAATFGRLHDDTDFRPCVIRFMDGDSMTHECTVGVPRLDVVLRRKVGNETYVVARARTDVECARCRVNITYHMHTLRMSGEESDTVGYSAHDTPIWDDVDRICTHEGTTMYYVVNDDPFDTRLYGAMRMTTRNACEVAKRFGIEDLKQDFGVDFIVDRFFASSASSEINAGRAHGSEFVRRFMIDALRVVAQNSNVDTVGERFVPIASAAPVCVVGASCYVHVDDGTNARESMYDGIACAADIMAEREDWVTRKFFKLYRVPASRARADDAGNAKSWLKLVSPAKSRGDAAGADVDTEDVLEEEMLVTTFHAVARRERIHEAQAETTTTTTKCDAIAIARECGVAVNNDDDDDVFTRSIVDALACALTTDGGAPSHDFQFEPSCDVGFERATLTIRGAEPASSNGARAVVCPRAHTTSADALIESLLASMNAARVSSCVLVAACTRDARGALSFRGGDVFTRDALDCAAQHGLFTDGGVFKSHLMSSTGNVIIAARFTQRQFRIRASEMRDVDALVQIEADAWADSPEMRTAPSTIVERVTNNAAMNFIVEDIATGLVRGGMYTQFIESVEAAAQTTWETKESNRRIVGSTSTVQLLDVFVDQSYGAACASSSSSGAVSVGQELRNHVLHIAEHSNATCACAVTRTRGFRETQSKLAKPDAPPLEYEDYVRGRALDRGVYFHTSAGAEIVRIVTPWRAKDFENDGNGVLIRYDVREYAFSQAMRRGRHRSTKTRRPSDPTANGGEYANSIQAIAWEARARSFPVACEPPPTPTSKSE